MPIAGVTGVIKVEQDAAPTLVIHLFRMNWERQAN